MNNNIKRGVVVAAVLVGCLGLAVSAQGASFDCTKAGTMVEHLICDNTEISKLDDELNRAYSAVLKDKSRVTSIKQAQKLWMKERSYCTDSDCLEVSYRSRIDELKPDQERERFLTVLSKDKPLCDAYKRYVVQETARHGIYDFPVMCRRPFGKDYPEFTPVQWREIAPKDYPDLSGQVSRYIDYWPWDKWAENWAFKDWPEIPAPLSEKWFMAGAEDFIGLHAYGGVRMWLGEADIGNTGKTEHLVRVENGRCGKVTAYHPPRWEVPVMVIDSEGKRIETDKSEWILGSSVLSTPSKSPSGVHEISLESYDVFSHKGITYFDRVKDVWTTQYAKYDEHFASYSVYQVTQERTQLVCRFKFNKDPN